MIRVSDSRLIISLEYKFHINHREIYNAPSIGLNDSFLKYKTQLWDKNPRQVDVDLSKRMITKLNLDKFKV